MNSFIRWIGGKKALRNRIVEEFPNDFERYIEVFGGAGWVLFHKENHSKFEVFNDIDGELINLYRCVKYHTPALQEELQYIIHFKEYEDEILKLKEQGLTKQEIGEKLGFSFKYIISLQYTMQISGKLKQE